MAGYGQFCPVAKSLELLDERWTLLVIRELLMGSRHFNELRRGVPRMSPALLTKRLQRLMRAGVVDRFQDGNRVTYVLTPAGEALRPIVVGLGVWGTQWISELGEADLDPHLLMWDMKRSVDHDALPPGRTTVVFSFRGVPSGNRDWWMVMSPSAEADVCDFDPGYPVTATVRANLPAVVGWWRGDLEWRDALRAGEIEVDASTSVRRALPRWLKRSMFATVPRHADERVPAGV